LKVKIISLADEARTIRRLEKVQKASRVSLREHRVKEVRNEARAAQLAYAFLRGKAYKDCESSTHTSPDWKRVEALVLKYCLNETAVHYYRTKSVNKMTDQQYNYVWSPLYKDDILTRFKKWIK